MKRCATCNIPLCWAYLVMGLPFRKRAKKYKDATNCIDLILYKTDRKIRDEAREQASKGGEHEAV